MPFGGQLNKLDDYRFEIPASYKPGMNVPGLVYASEKLLAQIREDQSLEQVANVATIPGILKYSYAMPDIHWGYGFPIGGVCATDWETGVVSPGGVGYDINCGVRLLRTNLTFSDVEDRLQELVNALFRWVPCGVGESGSVKLNDKEMDAVLETGVRKALSLGFGWDSDADQCEESGCMPGADAGQVSGRAKERGHDQMGTLGAGNHFLEVQRVSEIFDEATASRFGLVRDAVTVMIHCGSRGLGHQVCEDFLKVMRRAVETYRIRLPDPQLACTPVQSPEGQNYLKAMTAAANFAWANRHTIAHFVRKAFEEVFKRPAESLGMNLVYDVAHNIAKKEKHRVNGHEQWVCVHRKGATRAFPAGHPAVPAAYRDVGQPVLIPGNMGTSSFVLVGAPLSMAESWGSSCHGAGRVMSRSRALKSLRGEDVVKSLEKRGIVVKGKSWKGVAEEAPEVYKDVDEVVRVVHDVGLAKRVVRLLPLAVVKG
ncbi:MAG: RtcB family protein [bacterium]